MPVLTDLVACHQAPEGDCRAVSQQSDNFIWGSGGGSGPSEDEDSDELSPSGSTTKSESDSEVSAMLSWAVENIGLEWNPPPNLECSRLDDRSIDAWRNLQPQPASVPIFPEVYEEVTKS